MCKKKLVTYLLEKDFIEKHPTRAKNILFLISDDVSKYTSTWISKFYLFFKVSITY